MTEPTSMVEKVATAINAAVAKYLADYEARAEEDPTFIPWIGFGDIPTEVLARAAIEAMREPTLQAVVDGSNAIVGVDEEKVKGPYDGVCPYSDFA